MPHPAEITAADHEIARSAAAVQQMAMTVESIHRGVTDRLRRFELLSRRMDQQLAALAEAEARLKQAALPPVPPAAPADSPAALSPLRMMAQLQQQIDRAVAAAAERLNADAAARSAEQFSAITHRADEAAASLDEAAAGHQRALQQQQLRLADAISQQTTAALAEVLEKLRDHAAGVQQTLSRSAEKLAHDLEANIRGLSEQAALAAAHAQQQLQADLPRIVQTHVEQAVAAAQQRIADLTQPLTEQLAHFQDQSQLALHTLSSDMDKALDTFRHRAHVIAGSIERRMAQLETSTAAAQQRLEQSAAQHAAAIDRRADEAARHFENHGAQLAHQLRSVAALIDQAAPAGETTALRPASPLDITITAPALPTLPSRSA